MIVNLQVLYSTEDRVYNRRIVNFCKSGSKACLYPSPCVSCQAASTGYTLPFVLDYAGWWKIPHFPPPYGPGSLTLTQRPSANPPPDERGKNKYPCPCLCPFTPAYLPCPFTLPIYPLPITAKA